MTSPHVLLTATAMQAVDARAVADGADGFALMRRAGEAVARHVRRLVDPDARVVIVAGAGSNGGDGAVAAAALMAAGFGDVVLVRAGGEARPRSDAARAFARWSGRTRSVPPDADDLPDEVGAAIDGADLLVDALLGAGLGRDVDGRFADLVRAMNAAGGRVDGETRDGPGGDGADRRARRAGRNPVSPPLVAVDLPSGLDGDAHAVRGVAVRATRTVTFVRAKVAHRLQPGRAFCGEVVVEDIGMPDGALASVLADEPAACHANDPALWRDALPRPRIDDHKFRRGHVLVRGGPVHQTGAARLSATAALHAGAGLVTLASPVGALAVNAAHLTAVMLRPIGTDVTADADADADADEETLDLGSDGFAAAGTADARGVGTRRLRRDADWQALLDDDRIGAVVVGPGNGVDGATGSAVDAAMATRRALVLDADALTCHGTGADAFLARLREAPATAVLTPHEGELARLFGHTDILSLPSRLHRARAAAGLAGAVVVLKGPDTVVATPDGRATINANAPPWLATAGAGDVLAGAIAALLAQGMPVFEAASAAVWLHADAARALGWPLTAERLVPAVGAALGRLGSDAVAGRGPVGGRD